MGQMVIGTTELKNKIEELRALNTQFKSAVSELENTEGALNGMWEGDAKNTFHNAFMSDKQQMDNFYSTIELYAQKLEVILANMCRESRKILRLQIRESTNKF